MYAFTAQFQHAGDFESAITRVKDALMAEKFGIVSEVNVQAVMKNKLNIEMPGYRMLGACMPSLAKRVLDADPDAGALLPCNVIVRAAATDEQQITVTFMDPEAVLGLAEHDTVDEVAREARDHLEKVRERLNAG